MNWLSVKKLISCWLLVTLLSYAGNPVHAFELALDETTQPISATPLTLENNRLEQPITVSGSQLYKLKIQHDMSLYRIKVSAEHAKHIVLEVNQLVLNEHNQATNRTVLAKTQSQAVTGQNAMLPYAFYPAGDIYIGIATATLAELTLTIERKPEHLATKYTATAYTKPPQLTHDLYGDHTESEICFTPQSSTQKSQQKVTLISDTTTPVSLYLKDEDHNHLEYRSALGKVELSNVSLAPHPLCILVGNTHEAPPRWRLLYDMTRTKVRTHSEPDFAHYFDSFQIDKKQQFATLPENEQLAATLDIGDKDYFNLSPKQTLFITLTANAPVNACYVQNENQSECFQGQELEIGPLQPSNASYLSVSSISDHPVAYQLSQRVAPYQAGHLYEPNLDASFQQVTFAKSQPLLKISGQFINHEDRDSFTVDLGDTAQLWRFIILGDSVEQVILENRFGQEVLVQKRSQTGRRFNMPDIYLDAGISRMRLFGQTGNYKIVAKPLGQPPSDREIENNQITPQPLVLGQTMLASLSHQDIDTFSFYLPQESHLDFTLTVPAGAAMTASIKSGDNIINDAFNDLQFTTGTQTRQLTLPAGQHQLVLAPIISSPAEYEFTLAYRSPFVKQNKNALNLTISPLNQVQAFSRFAQQIPLIITGENPFSSNFSGHLEFWLPIPHSELNQGAPVIIKLEASQVTQGNYTLHLPADMNIGQWPLFLALKDQQQEIIATTQTTLRVTASAPLQSPTFYNAVTKPLSGGLDVARASLGARWVAVEGYPLDHLGDYVSVTETGNSNLNTLIDSATTQGQPPESHEAYLAQDGRNILAPVLALPGTVPLEIAGVAINTMMRDAVAIKQFSIEVSIDGITWQKVLDATHTAYKDTVFYPFQRRVQARLVRLSAVPESSKTNHTIALNDFQVIATPNSKKPFAIDLADIRHGALVSAMAAEQPNDRTLLVTPLSRHGDEASNPILFSKDKKTDLNFAITFADQQIAQIGEVHLLYKKQHNDAQLPNQAIVYTSNQGPAGPYQEVTRVDLNTLSPEERDNLLHYQLALPEYVSANAVKVEYELEKADYFQAPIKIKVFERPESNSYQSILGARGDYVLYPMSNPEQPLMLPQSASEVVKLNIGQQATGLVQYNKLINQWRIDKQANTNVARVRVISERGFIPHLSVTNHLHQAVSLLKVKHDELARFSDYYYLFNDSPSLTVTVTEKQRSAIFLYDQSGSMGPYLNKVRDGIIHFASAMTPKRDALLFKSFGADWGSENWLTNEQILRRTLSRYMGGDTSNAEPAILDALEKIKPRTGAQAIIVITDGDVDLSPSLSQAIQHSKAKIYVVKTPSGGLWQNPELAQAIVKQWAGLSEGEVFLALNTHDVGTAYAKINNRLLGPKSYAISATTESINLKPGWLTVTTNNHTTKPSEQLIILDGSGSMLKRINGTPRIAIAKRALHRYLDVQSGNSNPTAIGLRVFGIEPHSCDTSLLMSPTSGNRADIKGQINQVQPKNYAKTAIAAALLASQNDFSALSNQILLVTDGEETCGGDVAAAIRALAEKGINTRLDIVSFALAPEVTRDQFKQWAQLGNGIYIDAQTEQQLSDALNKVKAPRFAVYKSNDKDNAIAMGVSNDKPFELPAGQYLIQMENDPTFHPVVIHSAQSQTLDLTSNQQEIVQ